MSHRLSIKLQLDNPCHEDWEAMTEVPTGRFCKKCQSTVVDMTNWSDADFVAYFNLNRQQVCVRVRDEQLNRVFADPQPPIRVNRNYERALGIILAFFSLQQGGSATTRNETGLEEIIQTPAIDSSSEPITITGRIVDLHSKPLSGVKISLQDKIYHSDSEGRFTITLSDLGNSVLIFEYDGLERQVRSYNRQMMSTDFQIQMYEPSKSGWSYGGLPIVSYYLPDQYGVNYVSITGKSLDSQTKRTLATFAAILQSNPDFKVKLQTFAGKDIKPALKRAFLVVKYLTDKLNIDENRFLVPPPKKLEQASDKYKVYFLPLTDW